MKQIKNPNAEKLFNPNYIFTGNPEIILKDYPKRSENLELSKNNTKSKTLNNKFIKDGYMYLLRGAGSGQESGFYSRLYQDKKTIESEHLVPSKVGKAQEINGNTPFLSATTNLYTAASFSNKERIYILKIPVKDVYKYQNSYFLVEDEYIIPDYISKDEIIKSVRYDKFKSIYNYLKNVIGLNITPIDLGIEDVNKVDFNKLNCLITYNNAEIPYEDYLTLTQEKLLKCKLKKPKRTIAIFTDAHALLEPTEAILNDMKKRNIKEIYSLGDNIGQGPNPKEVLTLLEENNVLSVQGNYEYLISIGLAPYKMFLLPEKEKHLLWTKSQLTNEQIKRIELYPHFINLNLANKKIALAHFANDVRCDFIFHDPCEYRDNLEQNKEAYKQFLYTNSLEQLKELASYLVCNISHQKSPEEIYAYLKEYIQGKSFKEEYAGIISYINNPLFLFDNKLHQITDYDYIFQGHVHFNYEETAKDTKINTLKAVGIGGKSDDEIDQATYTIIEEYDDDIKVKHINVPFDREKMCHAILKSELPNPEIRKYTRTN